MLDLRAGGEEKKKNKSCHSDLHQSSERILAVLQSLARPIFFPRIGDRRCDRIYSSFIAVHSLNNDYMGKQQVVWKEYFVEYCEENSSKA